MKTLRRESFPIKSALAAILLLAGVLRFWGLAENPPGLFRDEADKGYSTYSLLETGRDLSGRLWPLQIKSFGAYTTPFYHWLSAVPIGLVGPTVWSTRVVAALVGTLACGAVFLAGRQAAGAATGLFAALILALSPWHLLFSRWANQGILMTLFIPLAFWLTWKAIEEDPSPRARRWMVGGLAAVCWGLGWYSYAPAQMFVSLFLLALVTVSAICWGIGKRDPDKAEARTLFLIGAGSLLVVSPFLIDIWIRWDATQDRLRFLAGEDPFSLSRFVRNYLVHWSPRYLFYAGDGNPRHHVYQPLQGQLCLFESVSLLFGLVFLFRRDAPKRFRLWILLWLVLAPIPAALTNEGLPHALRTLMVVPGLALLGGFGLAGLLAKCTGNRWWLAAAVVGGFVVVQVAVTGYFLFKDYPQRASQYWEAGFLEAVRTVEENRLGGESCTVSGIVEFPQAVVEFVTLPDPSKIQAGEPVAGYRFLETGKNFDPRKDDLPGLLLLRSWEAKKAPWWKTVSPTLENEAMSYYWRLYRTTGMPKPAGGE